MGRFSNIKNKEEHRRYLIINQYGNVIKSLDEIYDAKKLLGTWTEEDWETYTQSTYICTVFDTETGLVFIAR